MKNVINYFKRLKKRYVIIIIIIIIPIVMLFVPVKFAVSSDDIDKNKEYYILELIYGDTTDSGWYIVDCRDYESLDSHYYVHLNGKVPSDYISEPICYEYRNKYIVYGSLKIGTQNGKYDILTVDSWDIMSDIHGGIHKKYLTVYDLYWFPWLSEKTEKWRADET